MWIAKYGLDITTSPQRLMMTRGKVIHVGEQEDRLHLWAMIDSDEGNTYRTFRVIGTGPSFVLPYSVGHIGTVKMADGIMWHVFEVAR